MYTELKNNKYFNRELSWLEFDQRVLEEASDNSNPLFEQAKFLAIVSSNLDEFFMVRVAGLKDQIDVGYDKRDPLGLSPYQQLEMISKRIHAMVGDEYKIYNNQTLPSLEREGIKFLKEENLNRNQYKYLKKYFVESIYPVLTPMAVDSSRPFPHLANKKINISALISKDKHEESNFIFTTVQVPSVLPRIIEIPNIYSEDDNIFKSLILLEDVILMFLDMLFSQYHIISACPYRITRNSDLSIEEEDAEDLMLEIEKSIKMRQWGGAVRLEISKDMDYRIKSILMRALIVEPDDVYEIDGPLDLTHLFSLSKYFEFEHLMYRKTPPVLPNIFQQNISIFDMIKKKDILLHHPYQSFKPVVDFIDTASKDPNVLAIKQTLYRVSGNSPIINSLVKAAEAGKQVTVLVELKARFDEENNIQWAKRLEKVGAHVIYGLVGLKTHSKIILVVRKEEEGIKRYVHLGTGNYNDITAKLYTDIGLFTCNELIGADASALFNMLSGYSNPPQWHKLHIAPIDLRKKFIAYINNEKKNALAGHKAKIIAKMNSLVDIEIINALYDASQAGVKIELIIRGICCLRAGVEGLSDNIRVISVVGRYLEHSRIYYFYNSGQESLYLSSADWMPRNLDRRVEILFPIEDRDNKDFIVDILTKTLKDNVKARVLNVDGTYSKIKDNDQPFSSQTHFYKSEKKKLKLKKSRNVFTLKPVSANNR